MSWVDDAALAGQLERGHKVYLSLLIARSVEPGEGQGRKNLGEKSPKTSQSSFAEHAGIDKNTVGKYLKTWDAMAQDGIVPLREELTPGVDVELPEYDKWRDYYRAVNPSKRRDATRDNSRDLTDQANYLNLMVTALATKELVTLNAVAQQKLGEILRRALEDLEQPTLIREDATITELDRDSIPGLDLTKRRVQSATRMAATADVSRIEAGCQPHVKRLAEALKDMALAEDPTKSFVAACLALGDLIADLSQPRVAA